MIEEARESLDEILWKRGVVEKLVASDEEAEKFKQIKQAG